jgi:hypothetical protein
MDLDNQKGEKEKETPKFLSIQMKGLLLEKGGKAVIQDVFIFLEFRNIVLLRGV